MNNTSTLESNSFHNIPISVDSSAMPLPSSVSPIATNSSLKLPVAPATQSLPSTVKNLSRDQHIDEHEMVYDDELILVEELELDDLEEEDDV